MTHREVQYVETNDPVAVRLPGQDEWTQARVVLVTWCRERSTYRFLVTLGDGRWVGEIAARDVRRLRKQDWTPRR